MDEVVVEVDVATKSSIGKVLGPTGSTPASVTGTIMKEKSPSPGNSALTSAEYRWLGQPQLEDSSTSNPSTLLLSFLGTTTRAEPRPTCSPELTKKMAYPVMFSSLITAACGEQAVVVLMDTVEVVEAELLLLLLVEEDVELLVLLPVVAVVVVVAVTERELLLWSALVELELEVDEDVELLVLLTDVEELLEVLAGAVVASSAQSLPRNMFGPKVIVV
mmetsp:Transcript_16924/g.39515  ORF Transcript_16924/g.39515 Transcript_16924/m.39515 type:complete len:219 (+) Transcript_16924:464-1120(+)